MHAGVLQYLMNILHLSLSLQIQSPITYDEYYIPLLPVFKLHTQNNLCQVGVLQYYIYSIQVSKSGLDAVYIVAQRGPLKADKSLMLCAEYFGAHDCIVWQH